MIKLTSDMTLEKASRLNMSLINAMSTTAPVAPLRPCSRRERDNANTESTNTLVSDDKPNKAIPIIKSGFRPKLSESGPWMICPTANG